MAGDFKHKSVGTQLTQEEFEGVELHELDGVQFGTIVLKSVPPSGKYKIFNMYMEKVGSIYKLYIEHSDVPEP